MHQLGIFAQVDIGNLGVGDIEYAQLGVFGDIERLNGAHIHRQAHQIGTFGGVEVGQCLIGIPIKGQQLGEGCDVKIGRDIVNNIHLENHQFGVIIADNEGCLGGKGVVAEIYGCEFGVGREVERLEHIVLQIKDFEVVALAQVYALDICTFREEVIDERRVGIDGYFACLTDLTAHHSTID